MKQILSIMKALSDRNRLRVVGVLMGVDELCACQLTEFLQIKGATVSRHLSILAQAGIVGSRKEGRWVYFWLEKKNKMIAPVLTWIEAALENDKSLHLDREKIKTILTFDPEEICRKQRGETCCPEKKGGKNHE